MEIHELDGLGGPKKYKPKHRQKVKRDGLGRIIIISDGNVTLDKKVCGHIQGEPCNCGKSPKEKIRYDLPKNTEKIKPKPNATTGQPVDRMGPKEVFLTNLMIERDNMRASEMIVKERLKQKGVDLKGLGSLTVADLLDEIIAAVALKNEDGDFMKSASVQGLLGLGNVRGKKGLGLFKNLRDTLKKAGSSGDAIQNKILNKTKSVTGSVLDKAKSAALGIPRYLFEQFISKAPGLALYFLPSFVNNRAVLLKYPKVNRKKQKTDRILQFLSKLVRLDRDGMMKVLRTAIINKTRQTPDMLLKQFVQQSTVKGLGVIPPQLIMVIIQALPLILNLVKMFMDKTGEAPPEMPAEGDILQEADFLDDVQTMVNLPANTGFDTNEAGQTGQVDSEGNFLDFGVNTSVGLDQPTQDLITNLKDDAWDATKIIMWVGGGLTVITIAGLVIYGITKNKK